MADGLAPTFFVSDLHLRGPDDPNQKLFLQFLETRVRAENAQLVVAGDLFDFWYGLPGRVPPPFQEVVDALERLPSVLYLEGNHDVRVSRALGAGSRIEAGAGSRELRVHGLRVHVEHGDHVDRADVGHLAFKRLMLSFPASIAARLMGERALQWLGGTAALVSRGDMDGVLGQQPRWLEAARTHAAIQATRGLDLTVVGHGHWLGWWPEALICLGDWLVFHSYLRIDSAGPRLMRYCQGPADTVVATSPGGPVRPT